MPVTNILLPVFAIRISGLKALSNSAKALPVFTAALLLKFLDDVDTKPPSGFAVNSKSVPPELTCKI